MNGHSFITGTPINKPLVPLSEDELRRLVPSAFATHPHYSRTAKYVAIPTIEVLQALFKLGYVPYQATQSHSRTADKQGFTKHMIRLGHKDAIQNLKVGDSIAQACLTNSYDGSTPYELDAGLHVLLCANGLMAGGEGFERVKVYHKGDVVDDVVDGTYRVLGQANKALNRSKEWIQLQLTDGEQKAFAESAHQLRFADGEGKITTPIVPDQLLHARRPADGNLTDGSYRLRGPYGFAKTDLWTTFNVVQENAIKGGLRGRTRDTRGRRITTRGVNGIDQDVRLNRALWTLAERMAELKAA
jgi:hypothetical protein